MSKIATCLWFDDKAEEAADFYVSVFREMGQDAAIGDVLRFGKAGPRPEGMVLTVAFSLAGDDFVALNGGPQYSFSPAVSLMVRCRDQEEVDGFWRKLGAGGREVQCGWLTDRFGFSWQVVPTVLLQMLGDADRDRADRVMAAMLPMVKLDVAALQRAYDAA